MRDKPRFRYEDLPLGMPLGPIRYRVTPEAVRTSLNAVGQAVPRFLEDPVTGSLNVDPSLYVRNGIRLLRQHFQTEGIIHARAEVALAGAARAGEELTVVGRVADKYVRRERRCVVVESTGEFDKLHAIGLVRAVGGDCALPGHLVDAVGRARDHGITGG